MSDTIHVAYCLDDGYAEPTCVSMASMLANTKSNVHFHVISNRLSEENKAKLVFLKELFPHGDWSFHGIEFDETAFITSSYLSVETYYRLFLPAILPELERIIYIDGDTVVVGDILELWNENLEDKAAGVVSSLINSDKSSYKTLFNFKYNWYYFGAGVLLLNLKKIGKLYTVEKLPEIIKSLYDRYIEDNVPWCADQEVLNYLINGEEHAKFLNIKYNLEDLYKITDVQSKTLKDYANSCNFPVIIHFIGAKKPWHLNAYFMPFKHWRLYYKYKALTQFYDPNDEKKIVEYSRKENITKTECLLPENSYIKMFWQDIFANSAKYVKEIIKNRKIVFWGATRYITNIMAVFASENLYPNAVVDGLACNIGKNVFEYIVQPTKILKDKADEYFVILTMESKKSSDIVTGLLKKYGYSESGFAHAFAEIYERENLILL